MTAFAHLFAVWFATVLVVPWLLIAIFPMVILILAIAALANDLARNRREHEVDATPPHEEPRGPLYVGMTYRAAHLRGGPLKLKGAVRAAARRKSA